MLIPVQSPKLVKWTAFLSGLVTFLSQVKDMTVSQAIASVGALLAGLGAVSVVKK